MLSVDCGLGWLLGLGLLVLLVDACQLLYLGDWDRQQHRVDFLLGYFKALGCLPEAELVFLQQLDELVLLVYLSLLPGLLVLVGLVVQDGSLSEVLHGEHHGDVTGAEAGRAQPQHVFEWVCALFYYCFS